MADVLRTDEKLIAGGLSQAEVGNLTRLLRKLLGAIECDNGDAQVIARRKGRST